MLETERERVRVREGEERARGRERERELVSWCFEPSQPQRITSGLEREREGGERERELRTQNFITQG